MIRRQRQGPAKRRQRRARAFLRQPRIAQMIVQIGIGAAQRGGAGQDILGRVGLVQLGQADAQQVQGADIGRRASKQRAA